MPSSARVVAVNKRKVVVNKRKADMATGGVRSCLRDIKIEISWAPAVLAAPVKASRPTLRHPGPDTCERFQHTKILLTHATPHTTPLVSLSRPDRTAQPTPVFPKSLCLHLCTSPRRPYPSPQYTKSSRLTQSNQHISHSTGTCPACRSGAKSSNGCGGGCGCSGGGTGGVPNSAGGGW